MCFTSSSDLSEDHEAPLQPFTKPLSPVVNLVWSYLCFQFGSNSHLDGSERRRVGMSASGRLHAFVVSLKPLPKSFLQKPLSLSHMYLNYCQSGLRVRGSLKINKCTVSENHTGIISSILYGYVGSFGPVFSFMAKPNASRKV